MDSTPLFSEPAALIGDPARANMLLALMDGRSLTATELASIAGISSQTASAHLSRLLDGRLLAMEKQGRHRYYRLRDAKVAQALESLIELAVASPRRHRPPGPRDAAMRKARTCYDHLAGRLGVTLTQNLIKLEYLIENNEDYDLTQKGRRALSELGLDIEAAEKAKRAFARRCLDWSERQPHLGGALGAALMGLCESEGWILRQPDSRVVTLSAAGQDKFATLFGPEFNQRLEAA